MSKLWESMVDLAYKLGNKTDCHHMPERSFFYKGHQFPVCARCTGVFIGQIVAFIVGFFHKVTVKASIILMGIMGIDWGIQAVKIKESTNIRRLITGILGGFGLYSIYWSIARFIKRQFSNMKNK